MAANRVLLFKFKTAQYFGKNSLNFLCILRRFNAQNAASTAVQKPTEKSQESGNLSQTEGEQWAGLQTPPIKYKYICTLTPQSNTMYCTSKMSTYENGPIRIATSTCVGPVCSIR